MSTKRECVMLASLIVAAITSGFLLASFSVSAASTTSDVVNVTVPASCTFTGVGMNSHTATLNPGAYNSQIGTTTFTAACNDAGGFAVYAIGYTDDTDGKNTMTSTTVSGHDIETGTGTTGNSKWAMKLSTVTSPTPTYPVSIQNSFDSFHTVPDDYTLVAKRESATDAGASATGSTFTSTYHVYASINQPAGTYVGQVKYVLVHPNNTDEIPVREDRFAVIFDGNGFTFPGGATRNRVVYGNSCSPMYIPATPEETLETSNLTDGVYDGTPYSEEEHVYGSFPLDGADMVRVVVDYGLTGDTGASITIAEGEWAGWDVESPQGYYTEIVTWDDNTGDSLNITGTKTFDFEGDTVSLEMMSWGDPIEDYDYGMYAKFYPLYETEQSGTTETTVCSIGSTPLSGAYAEPTSWSGRWYTYISDDYVDDELFWFEDESELFYFILESGDEFMGETLTVYAENPYKVYYNGNGATAGTMSGIYTTINDPKAKVHLTSPNFAKTGYGFAGWSESQSATINGSARIYGPNEIVQTSDLQFDNNRETTLYAVWVPNNGNMQNYNCSSLAIGQVTALMDTRDNNVYTVGRMQDGNCWMMENLRLDAINSSDSSKAQGFGGIFTGLANSEDINFSTNRANSKYTQTSTGSMYRIPRYNNNNTNIGGTNSNGVTLVPIPICNDDYSADCHANMSNHAQWYSYGNYYNWPAAIANTLDFSTEGASNSVDTSICPKGWSLPYGGASGMGLMNGSFSYLDTQIGGEGFANETSNEAEITRNWFRYPYNFIMAGYWSDSSGERGTFGTYWTRTNSGGSYAWRFVVTGWTVGYQAMSKTFATPVRCIIINN